MQNGFRPGMSTTDGIFNMEWAPSRRVDVASKGQLGN